MKQINYLNFYKMILKSINNLKKLGKLYIDNLYNINNIVINVLQNGSFCTATAFYVCILTFVEC